MPTSSCWSSRMKTTWKEFFISFSWWRPRLSCKHTQLRLSLSRCQWNRADSRDLRKEVSAQTTQAALISGYLRDIIWRNKYLSVETKSEYTKPVLDLTEALTNGLMRETEMRTLRSMVAWSLLDDDIKTAMSKASWVSLLTGDKIWETTLTGWTPPDYRNPPIRWYESWKSASQLKLWCWWKQDIILIWVEEKEDFLP